MMRETDKQATERFKRTDPPENLRDQAVLALLSLQQGPKHIKIISQLLPQSKYKEFVCVPFNMVKFSLLDLCVSISISICLYLYIMCVDFRILGKTCFIVKPSESQ